MRSVVGIAVVLLLAGCRPAVTPVPAPVFDRLVNIGDRALHLHCTGEGAPAVVLESGLGNDGSVWSDVQPGIAGFTRVCAYDRAGLGYSPGPAPRPHTNRLMARELHALLERAGVPGPYVLVGHSMGGVNVRLFASEHLDSVAGMVLVDATVDPLANVSEAQLAEFRALVVKANEGTDLDTFAAGAAEARKANTSLGDRPLVVLTAGQPANAAAGPTPWQRLQEELPGLSTNSVHVTATNCHHFLQWEAPDLVVEAVHEVVVAARTHRRVQSSTLTPRANEPARIPP